MKKAIKAFSPGDKLYNIERMHSKLIHFSKFQIVLSDLYEKRGFSIDLAVSALKDAINCFNVFGDSPEYKNYVESIDNTMILLKSHRDKKNNDLIRSSFCLMSGAFNKYKRVYKKQIKKFCEIQYQEICFPMYKLDHDYIKNHRLKNYPKSKTEISQT